MIGRLSLIVAASENAIDWKQLESMSNWRSNKLLASIRDCACQRCGAQDGTVVAAHSNQLRDGKGKSIKAHDYRIAALCYRCHTEIDQGSTMTKQERIDAWEEAHRGTIGWLFQQGILKV
jgi:hypothetical protein